MRAHLPLLTFVALFWVGVEAHAQVCGRADGSAEPPRASDALAALHASTGTPGACRLCLCDVDHSGAVTASDALTILTAAVGAPVELDCANCACALPKRFVVGEHPRIVHAGDFDRDGDLDLIDAEDESRSLSLLAGIGDGAFADRRTIDPSGAPMSATVADLNGDDVLDVVTANLDPSAVAVMIGRGDGTFATPALLAAGDSPVNVAVGDLTGDGRADLAAVNSLSNDVSVYVADGTGGYTPRPRVAVGVGPRWIELADLTGDGKTDAIVANRDSHSLSLLAGSGDGSFADAKTIAVCAGAHQAIPADLDRDGKPDLVVPCKADRTLAVLHAKGGGEFASPHLHDLQATAIAAAVADMQGDGKLDVVVTAWRPNLIVFFEGLGDGTLRERSRADTTPQPRGIALADVTGDGLLDVVVAGTDSNDLLMFPGNGDVALGTKFQQVRFRPYVRDMAPADFNGDGVLDFVAANWHALSGIYTRDVLTGARFAYRELIDIPRFPSAVIAGDFNGDHKTDFVVKNNKVAAPEPGKRCNDPHLAFFAGHGDFTFSPELRVAAANLSHHTDDDFAGGDFGGDGIDDLVVIERQAAAVTYMRGKTDGQFEVVQRIPVDTDAQHLVVGDFNGDGAPDIAWVQGADLRDLVVRLRDEHLRFGFAANATIRLDAQAAWLVAGDLDLDGRADLVNGFAAGTNVEARFAEIDGTFSAAVRSNIGRQFFTRPDLVDANPDHALDLDGHHNAGTIDPFVPNGGPPMVVAGGSGGRFGPAAIVDPGGLVPALRPYDTTAILPVNVDDDPSIDVVVAYYRGKERTSGITLYNIGMCAELPGGS
jgi:hypothetical protein